MTCISLRIAKYGWQTCWLCIVYAAQRRPRARSVRVASAGCEADLTAGIRRELARRRKRVQPTTVSKRPERPPPPARSVSPAALFQGGDEPLGVGYVRGGARADLPVVVHGGPRVAQRVPDPAVTGEQEGDDVAGLPGSVSVSCASSCWTDFW
jgi:hypothetical protein